MRQHLIRYHCGLMTTAVFLLTGTMQASGNDDVRGLPLPYHQSNHITMERVLVSKVCIGTPRDGPDRLLAELEDQVRAKYPQIPFRFEIWANGPDLMQEGITKSRSFTIEDKRTTVADALTTILSEWNPIRGAKLYSDDMRLIWVIEKDRLTGEPQILITTREGAKKRRLEVPDIFERTDGRLPEPSPLLRPLTAKLRYR